MAQGALQTGFTARGSAVMTARVAAAAARARDSIEEWLWAERESLILWVPVAYGAGISLWFLLPGPRAWAGFMLVMAATALLGWAMGGRRWRTSGALCAVALAALLGCAAIWARSMWVAAPVLERPVIATFGAFVDKVEPLPAREQVRLVLRPVADAGLPPRIRVTARTSAQGIERVRVGDAVRLRARLVPPPRAALPGGYDFAQRAWFDRIGAVGSLLGPIARDERFGAPPPGLRARLSSHVRERVPGGAGAIAATLATGDRGGISAEDDEAMRRSGLAHLLSISGLHVSAMVAGTIFLLIRLLALSPWLALRWPLTLIAAAGGAAAGLGYTLLTGGEVPTVRSLLAAILVLIALAIGREAITMRLLATGAMVVMLLWPEVVVGPSFQLSFAAVASIVALHSHPAVQRLLSRRDEGLVRRWMRGLAGLLATGLVVELALMPIALFHFHKAGIYGALANMVAIPLTTFIVMPFEALALLLDTVGLGAPAWWVVGHSLDAMLAMAHMVANAPGAVASVPTMPTTAFALCIAGGLWVLLWRGRHRWFGLCGVTIGLLWASQVPSPDILVTADGRHVAIRTSAGGYALLRARAGDFVRQQLAESAGIDEQLTAIEDVPGARCSDDFCSWPMSGGGRTWQILAARSRERTDWRELVEACARADIVIADRWLPRACAPRWFNADGKFLARTGGLSIRLDPPQVTTSLSVSRGKPWNDPPTVAPPREPRPASAAATPARAGAGVSGIAARGLRDAPAP